ncbi:hypothetical protein ACFQNE_03275 [Gordonia phosphorivorans]|uniref:Uncharacterized protein n=1 Tax=Gordonia phosphorivorans TaxID=1056982 RepID=A0ABV6H3T9_9ACTN
MKGSGTMSQELVALDTSVRAIGSAITAIITTYRNTRAYRQAELDVLRDRLAAAKVEHRMRASGNLMRVTVEEIQGLQRMIDSAGLTGYALECAMGNLRVLNDTLLRNFRDFNNG